MNYQGNMEYITVSGKNIDALCVAKIEDDIKRGHPYKLEEGSYKAKVKSVSNGPHAPLNGREHYELISMKCCTEVC